MERDNQHFNTRRLCMSSSLYSILNALDVSDIRQLVPDDSDSLELIIEYGVFSSFRSWSVTTSTWLPEDIDLLDFLIAYGVFRSFQLS